MGRRILSIAAAAAAAVLALGGLTAVVGEPSEAANTYTGCLNRGGAINKVAIGDQPARACASTEVEIGWSEGVSPADVAELAERVAALEAGTRTLEASVDCGAGESVGEILAQARDHLGPVSITVSGVCQESIQIQRDDVTIRGESRSDGFSAPESSSPWVVGLDGARRVGLNNMTISGGQTAIALGRGAQLSAGQITMRGTSHAGISVDSGSSGDVWDSLITDNARFGASATNESTLVLENTRVTGSGEDGLFSGGVGGASIMANNCEIIGNGSGAGVNPGGNLRLSGTTVADNDQSGVFSFGAGVVVIDGPSRISGNQTGIQVTDGGMASIQPGPVVVEDNRGDGITASGGSSLNLSEDVVVRGNGGSGIAVGDLSTVSLPGGGVITDNGGWGILCEGPPAVAVIGGQGLFNPLEITFSGNALGSTSCATE